MPPKATCNQEVWVERGEIRVGSGSAGTRRGLMVCGLNGVWTDEVLRGGRDCRLLRCPAEPRKEAQKHEVRKQAGSTLEARLEAREQERRVLEAAERLGSWAHHESGQNVTSEMMIR